MKHVNQIQLRTAQHNTIQEQRDDSSERKTIHQVASNQHHKS